jgi:predicted O-methyltransferase YrrM
MNKIVHPSLKVKVHNRDGYFYTHKDLVTDHIKIWEPLLAHLIGKPCDILEIGSLQGNSAVYWLNNILTHDESSIMCIEPFGRTKRVPDRELFMENIKKTGYSNKVHLLEMTSDNFFIKNKLGTWDVIYIDGSHEAEQVAKDCANSLRFCKKGGIIIMDDYKMRPYFADDNIGPRPAIDEFLLHNEDKLEILHKGYQVIVKRSL